VHVDTIGLGGAVGEVGAVVTVIEVDVPSAVQLIYVFVKSRIEKRFFQGNSVLKVCHTSTNTCTQRMP
jgi:hypothetical protein